MEYCALDLSRLCTLVENTIISNILKNENWSEGDPLVNNTDHSSAIKALKRKNETEMSMANKRQPIEPGTQAEESRPMSLNGLDTDLVKAFSELEIEMGFEDYHIVLVSKTSE